MQQWEYLVRIYKGEINGDNINDLGIQGWELVSVLIHCGAIHYYFKRKLQ